MNPTNWYLYARCYNTPKGDKIYIGITTDMKRRQIQHDASKGSLTTKRYNTSFGLPVWIAYRKFHCTHNQIRKIEAKFKKYNNKKKISFMEKSWKEWVMSG